MNTETAFRGEIIELDGWNKRDGRAENAIFRVDRHAIDEAQAFAGEFSKGAGLEIKKADHRWNDERRARVVPENGLVSLAVEGHHRRDFKIEVSVSDFKRWPESVRANIGREDRVVTVATKVKGKHGDF